MAKFRSLLDALTSGKGLSGTIGDRVYYHRNGISYCRSKPVSRKNPQTPGQLTQRAKFNVVLKFLQPLKEFIHVGFRLKAKNMSAFNYAMSFVYKNALTGEYPDFSIDYSRVLLSMGNLAGAFEPKIVLTSAREIEFTWQIDPAQYNYFLNDRVMVLVYNPAKQEAIMITNGDIRIKLRQQVKLPFSFAGDEVICYMAFQDSDEKRTSDSQYLGRLQVD